MELAQLAERLGGLDQRLRAIGVLSAKWGLSSAEIAEVFGVSESRILQLQVELRARLEGTDRRPPRGPFIEE